MHHVLLMNTTHSNLRVCEQLILPAMTEVFVHINSMKKTVGQVCGYPVRFMTDMRTLNES